MKSYEIWGWVPFGTHARGIGLMIPNRYDIGNKFLNPFHGCAYFSWQFRKCCILGCYRHDLKLGVMVGWGCFLKNQVWHGLNNCLLVLQTRSVILQGPALFKGVKDQSTWCVLCQFLTIWHKFSFSSFDKFPFPFLNYFHIFEKYAWF